MSRVAPCPEPEQVSPVAQRRLWVLVALYAGAILVATSVPVPPALPAPDNSDKVVHLLMYAGLGALFLRAKSAKSGLREPNRRVAVLCFLTALVYCCLFGALDEWHQQFVGRSTSFADWVADAIGVAAGAGCMLWYLRRDHRA